MFGNNYNAESALKGVAKATYVIGVILTVLAELGGLITFCSLARFGWLAWIGVGIMILGSVVYFIFWFSANHLWGFADIVGTVRRISEKIDVVAENTAGHSAPSADDELPEV